MLRRISTIGLTKVSSFAKTQTIWKPIPICLQQQRFAVKKTCLDLVKKILIHKD
jgi:hypothetical protein